MTPGEYPCGDRLVEQDGFCRHCGSAGYPACDRGEPCPDPESVPNKNFTWCLHAGGPNQPCRRDGRCTYDGLICNQKGICEPCGSPGQICCPPSTGLGPCYANTAAECRDGRCFACGVENMPVCPTGALCRDSSEPYFGWCRHCGNEGEVCCKSQSIRCNSPLKCKDGVCQRTPASGGGGGGGGQFKTCSGKDWTFATSSRAVARKLPNTKCIVIDGYPSNSSEEAYECARKLWGDAVVTDTISPVKFAQKSDFGCTGLTIPCTDESDCQKCAESYCTNCTTTLGDCP